MSHDSRVMNYLFSMELLQPLGIFPPPAPPVQFVLSDSKKSATAVSAVAAEDVAVFLGRFLRNDSDFICWSTPVSKNVLSSVEFLPNETWMALIKVKLVTKFYLTEIILLFFTNQKTVIMHFLLTIDFP